MSWLQTECGNLVRQFSRLGTGKPLQGTLRRITATGPPDDPAGHTEQTWDFYCMWPMAETYQRTNSLIEDLSLKLTISAESINTIPHSGDTVTVQNRTYSIKAVEVVRPGGETLIYKLSVVA